MTVANSVNNVTGETHKLTNIDRSVYNCFLRYTGRCFLFENKKCYSTLNLSTSYLMLMIYWVSYNKREIKMRPKIAMKKPLPPFTHETALQKIRMAEDGWNGQNPKKIALSYSQNSVWRNRSEFVTGREQIIQLLTHKWQKELNYRLIKELWAYSENRIAVRFAYEYQGIQKQWFRAYGNENWQFNEQGLMTHRYASINDIEISESERKFHWQLGIRPLEHASLSDLGL